MDSLTPTQFFLVALFLLPASVFIYRTLYSKTDDTHVPLPPGPKPLPLIGNIPHLPPANAKPWIHWLKQSKTYGPLSSVTALGQTIIIISSPSIASELLEKRSATTSSRPSFTFGSKLCGWENGLAMMPYSPRTRAYRKALHSILGTSAAIQQFYSLIEIETARFLFKVLDNPSDVLQLIRTQAGSIILKVSYGYTIEPKGSDPLVDLADEALDQFSRACSPGTWMVDILPFLQYLPEWVPGMTFKKTARHWRATLQAVADRPYAFVEKMIRNGRAEESYLSKLIAKGDGGKPQELIDLGADEEGIARWSAFALYTGGADTTVSSMSCFVLAMTLYPEIQARAQSEIDAVTGLKGRLPMISDRSNLPYVDALLKEVLRWHPVAPIGVVHLVTKDGVYDGYSIPEGSFLMANIYAMLHDPEVYVDPERSEPSRFLGEKPEPDPKNHAFGFGRRVCPGKLFADAALFATIAGFLAVFDVRKARDKDGNVIEPVVDFTEGLISHPKPFVCDVRPRSKAHGELVRRIEVHYPIPKEGDAKYLDRGVVV